MLSFDHASHPLKATNQAVLEAACAGVTEDIFCGGPADYWETSPAGNVLVGLGSRGKCWWDFTVMGNGKRVLYAALASCKTMQPSRAVGSQAWLGLKPACV
jgi:hypothetical protein